MLHRFSLRSLFSVLGCCLFVLPVADAAAADIVGTAGDDLIIVNLTTSTVKVNGAETDVTGVSPIRVLADGGDDRVVVFGDPQTAEHARFNGKSIVVQDGVRVLRVIGAEDLTFRGHDDDRAVLLDSPGSDHLEISDELTFMDCPAFDFTVRGVKSINITADRGGTDTVDVQAEEIGRLSTHEDCVRLVPAAGSDYPTTHFLFGFEEVETTHVTSFHFEDTPNDDDLFALQRFIRWTTDDLIVTHRGDYDDITAVSSPSTLSGYDTAVVRYPKRDETRFSSTTHPNRSSQRTVRFANDEKLVIVQNFASNDFEVFAGPSSEDAVATFHNTTISSFVKGSLEDRTFQERLRVPGADAGVIRATGFEQFNLYGYTSGKEISDSSSDDQALVFDGHAIFEGNNCSFYMDQLDGAFLWARNGGFDTAITLDNNVSMTGDRTTVRDLNSQVVGTMTLWVFEDETHVGSAGLEASVFAGVRHHQVYVTPDYLSYISPSTFQSQTEKTKTAIGYSTYTVSATRSDFRGVFRYDRDELEVIYNNQNDPTLVEGTSGSTYFDTLTDTFLSISADSYQTSRSTLNVNRSFYDINTGNPNSPTLIPGIDSVAIRNR